jgi:hypothetical protein
LYEENGENHEKHMKIAGFWDGSNPRPPEKRKDLRLDSNVLL